MRFGTSLLPCALLHVPARRQLSGTHSALCLLSGSSQLIGHPLGADIAVQTGSIPARIAWRNAFNTLRCDRMLATTGVRQGDPLGPLLFALTLKDPLEQVAESQLAGTPAYTNDNFLQGKPRRSIRACQA
jgi:hypothetical protein